MLVASATAGLKRTMLLTSLLALPTIAAAQAPCTQWDGGGIWHADQGSFNLRFNLQQTGTNLQGEGHVYADQGALVERGGVDGTINGNAIEITAYWRAATIGVYKGTIGPTGRIDGWTYDKSNPGSRARWFSNDRLKCLARADAAPPPEASATPGPPAKKGKVLGKKKSSSANVSACASGYVWRVARPEDLVCVTPAARRRVARENQAAAALVDRKGDYGKNSCIIGYVWRNAFEGDGVCVTPEARDMAAQENQLGPSRRVGG